MSIIIPHHTSVQRHAEVPYLWRARCSCGWFALAADKSKADMAASQHIYEEEPFPDLFSEEIPNNEVH